MESTVDPDDAHGALIAVERAAAAPFIDYPPTPRWYYPAAGGWFAGMAALLVYDLPNVARFPILIALLALLGLFVAWYSRFRGAWPTLTGAPKELVPVLRGYIIAAVAVAAVVTVLAWQANGTVAVVTTFVLVTAGLAVYEGFYNRAAARTRERLA